MGATLIGFFLNGEPSSKEIQEAFKKRQKQDAATNPSEEAYTGDFQTVRRVEIKTYLEPFKTEAEATKYCLANAEKWEFVIAVRFIDENRSLKTMICGWGAE